MKTPISITAWYPRSSKILPQGNRNTRLDVEDDEQEPVDVVADLALRPALADRVDAAFVREVLVADRPPGRDEPCGPERHDDEPDAGDQDREDDPVRLVVGLHAYASASPTLVNVFPSSADPNKICLSPSWLRIARRGTPRAARTPCVPHPAATCRRAPAPARPRPRRPASRGRGSPAPARSPAPAPGARPTAGPPRGARAGPRAVGALERVQDGERVHTLAQVLPRLLPERRLARGEVHDVVGQLERQAQGLAEPLEHVEPLPGRVREHPPEPAGRRDERPRLAADHLEVVPLGLLVRARRPRPRGSGRRRAWRSSEPAARRCRSRGRSRSPTPARTGSRRSRSRRCCPSGRSPR